MVGVRTRRRGLVRPGACLLQIQSDNIRRTKIKQRALILLFQQISYPPRFHPVALKGGKVRPLKDGANFVNDDIEMPEPNCAFVCGAFGGVWFDMRANALEDEDVQRVLGL